MAVEIGYVRDVGVVEILTPTTYGEELKQSKGEHGKSVWDGATFVAALRARAPEEAAGIEAIMRWAEQDRVADLYGTGKDGSWYPVWHGHEMRDSPISAWTSGSVCINLPYFRRLAGFEEAGFRSMLAGRLENAGFGLTPNKDFPSIDGLDRLDDERRQQLFVELEWVKEQFSGQQGVQGDLGEEVLNAPSINADRLDAEDGGASPLPR